jgi:CheY-like chemotaxis protein
VEAKALSLRSAVDPDAGPVFGDPSRLQQVVWNLLTNAVKFTPKGGAIDVTVASVSSHVEITVHDSGTGISPEFLPHVFERFRQADSSTTRRYGGLGLGLSIVKRLVELHGGTITAESPGEGRGATFHVRLPVRVVAETGAMVRPQPPDRQELIVPASEISLAGTRVLVIDDVPDARELLQAVLCDAGASVLTAESAAEGLAVVQAHRPDVIVSDIGLPGCDGYEFVRDLRRLGSTGGGRTPAIALTAFARSEDRTRAMLAGYQVHMSKPVEPQELVATIKSLAVRGEQDA